MSNRGRAWEEFKSRMTCNYLSWVAISCVIIIIGALTFAELGYLPKRVGTVSAYVGIGVLAVTGMLFAYGILTDPLTGNPEEERD